MLEISSASLRVNHSLFVSAEAGDHTQLGVRVGGPGRIEPREAAICFDTGENNFINRVARQPTARKWTGGDCFAAKKKKWEPGVHRVFMACMKGF